MHRLASSGAAGRLDGWEVAKKAREKEPTLPVIYMSGAHAQSWASKGVPNSIMLTTPFAPAQLVPAVSQLLNIGARQQRRRVESQFPALVTM